MTVEVDADGWLPMHPLEEEFFAIYDPEDVERLGGAADWKVKT